VDILDIRNFCLGKKGVEECFPFNETTLVFKVGGKMFLLVDVESQPLSMNLKCTPEKAIELREQFTQVTPGYHMNKKHWNTVLYEMPVSNNLLIAWINESYELVFKSLPKKNQKNLL